MKLKTNFFYTIREDIKDEDAISSKLLIKSGMIKKVGNGIYIYMPLGLKVLNKIENIIREEMNQAGATELIMPNIIPELIFEESGRREIFGNSMFSLQDRYNRNYVLGPTHEELFVMAAKEKVRSYKDLPFNLYQIGLKYRDEPRPRYGLIRIREFIMKDAYSFDIDNKGLNQSYNKMFDAYKKTFDRLKIKYKIVTADTGVMGGLLSEEFQAISQIGEDTLVICSNCGYASNIEVSECPHKLNPNKEEEKTKELIYTPNVGTIEEVAKHLKVSEKKFVKTLIYKADEEYYACLVPGDRDVQETKVQKLLTSKEITLASKEEVETITKAKIGFAGPINLNIPIIIDKTLLNMKNFIVGANKTDYHYKNVNLIDIKYQMAEDIKNVVEGDPCPKCNTPIELNKGIEIGNTFKLGTKYSEDLNLYYTDQNNHLKPVVMGCYGIGVERIMASIIEQNNDDLGIIWPLNTAPFKVAIVIIDTTKKEQTKIATDLYNQLNKLGIDTLLDDRDCRAGVKFKDIDLIGIPIRVVVSTKIKDNKIELKLRNQSQAKDININEVETKIKEIIKENK